MNQKTSNIIRTQAPSQEAASATPSQASHKPTANQILIQAKLSIGTIDDPMEHEADAIADRVMRMPEPSFSAAYAGGDQAVQRKCSHCEEEEKAQRKPLISFLQMKSNGRGTEASADISRQIHSEMGGGNSLSGSTRSFMESRFGNDFSDVRIHTGAAAIQLSRELNAEAFTVGNDVFFNQGRYAPEHDSGKHLLAHELVHTIQQGNNQGGMVQRRIHSGHDNHGNYAFNDTNCTFDYNQRWFFQFDVPVGRAEKARLMSLASAHVHNTWSNRFPLIPSNFGRTSSCPCQTEGVSVSVNIAPEEGPKRGRGIRVTVLPHVRANVLPITGGMQVEHNPLSSDFDGHDFDSGHQYTVSHEFGHTIDITDEYPGWTAFFVPAVHRDAVSVMNEGDQVRTRHYQYFGDLISLEMLGCRYSPDGVREPERENPVFRSATLSGLTLSQDGMRFPGINPALGFGTNFDARLSNERLMGLFYPQAGIINLWNPDTGSQSDLGLTAGIRLGQIAHPLVVNLRAGVVTNPSNPASSVNIPVNLQVGLRTKVFEMGVHYTPVFNLLDPGQVTHLFGAGITF
jgi:hypothetical protein